MILLTRFEADYVKRNNKRNRMMVASINKNSNGKTYYVLGDDIPTLNMVAKLRNVTRKELLRNN